MEASAARSVGSSGAPAPAPAPPAAQGTDPAIADRLKGFDAYMEAIRKDWNAPGVGVGIVVGDELVLARGYGYRDCGQKLPFTRATMVQIASNTKLFTAVAAGMLVEEGRLTWDEPIRAAVPAIRFYNDDLDRHVTLRDMLAHRTGITRHDMIWYKSDFTRRELFERLRYMEPRAPLRQTFLYNNMMYAAVGHLIELQSGRTWEQFVRERIFAPLGMDASGYTIQDLLEQPDFGVPYTEKRDTQELHRIPYYEDTVGVAPCGAIVSNIDQMSRWLIALMNEGRYAGRQVLPAGVLRATLEPAIALPNTLGEAWGFWEVVNPAYGMGRRICSYRGHLHTSHGGALPGFYSRIGFLPHERIGTVVFVIGAHCADLGSVVSNNVYEFLLGLDVTPWSDRWLGVMRKGKRTGTEARARAGQERVADTRPSHELSAYVGEYEHPAYGILRIGLRDGQLEFDFHKIRLPLSHFHYDRFDTPNDELDGKWSVRFCSDPQGEIDRAVLSLDEAEATFGRRPQSIEPELLDTLPGTYRSPAGCRFRIIRAPAGALLLVACEQPSYALVPYRGLRFRSRELPDHVYEFLVENGQVTALKQTDPSGEYVFARQ